MCLSALGVLPQRLGKQSYSPQTLEVISDIHLSNSPQDSVDRNEARFHQLEPFLETLSSAPADQRFTVVLNGDILELTRDWKPWHKPPVINKSQTKTAAKLIRQNVEANKKFFDVLVEFIKKGLTEQGEALHKVIYIRGNHDRWIASKPGKQAFLEALGLSEPAKQAFTFKKNRYFDTSFNALIFHGDELDENCLGENNLGETVDILFLNQLGEAVLKNLDDNHITVSEADKQRIRHFLEDLYHTRPVKLWGDYIDNSFEFWFQNEPKVPQAIYEELSKRLGNFEQCYSRIGTRKKVKKEKKKAIVDLEDKTNRLLLWLGKGGLKFFGDRYEQLSKQWQKNKVNKKTAEWGRKTQKELLKLATSKLSRKVSQKLNIDNQIRGMKNYGETNLKRKQRKQLQYLIAGHTHTTFEQRCEKVWYLNPGGNERLMRYDTESGNLRATYPYGFAVLKRDAEGGVTHQLAQSSGE